MALVTTNFLTHVPFCPSRILMTMTVHSPGEAPRFVARSRVQEILDDSMDRGLSHTISVEFFVKLTFTSFRKFWPLIVSGIFLFIDPVTG